MNRANFLKNTALGLLYFSTPKLIKESVEKKDHLVIKSNLDQHKKDYDFLDETQRFLKEIPWHNMWKYVYDYDSNKVIFFSVEEKNGYKPGDIIEVFDKSRTWSSNNSLLKNNLKNIRGNWRTKANLLTNKLENEHEITWNSGRRSDVIPFIERYKEIIPTLTDIYEKHHLPKLLVSHIIAESSLNPLAQSSHAQGISQIHRNNNRLFRSKLRPYFNYDWKDFVSQAGLSAAMMNIAVKMNNDTYLPALTTYHAGRTNNERILAVGRA
ncbi:MAG: transglycosylase SLT domain-containing protein [Candidatus Woesearchaeota archaeon]